MRGEMMSNPANLNYHCSDTGLELTENSESLRLTPYLDSNGTPTDGWGNTHGVVMGQDITRNRAVSCLKSNIQSAENSVKALVNVPLTQVQFDALVDFVFNEGSGHFASSTLLHVLNLGNYSAASLHFADWNKAGGVTLAGLTKRRLNEANEFNGVTP
jgi:lysozyme